MIIITLSGFPINIKAEKKIIGAIALEKFVKTIWLPRSMKNEIIKKSRSGFNLVPIS